jgi:hypothetical protein
MRLKPILFLALLVYTVIACQQESKEENTQVVQEVFDPIPEIDSLFINALDAEHDIENYLKSVSVKSYAEKLITFETEAYMDSAIEGFLRIDSLKSNNQYNEYIDHLDLGDIKDAKAIFIEEWNFSPDTVATLWAIKYSSFEACPYYEGTDVYLTLIKNGDVLYTVQVGSNYHGADPPMSFDSYLFSKQNGNQLIMKLSQVELEMGETEKDGNLTIDKKNETHTFDLHYGRFIK